MKVTIFFLSIALFFTSCIGTKYLKKDEYILYKQRIEYNRDLDEEALQNQMVQTPNKKLVETRIFWINITIPIAHRVYIYELGKRSFDSVGLIQKRADIIKKYNRRITKAGSTARKERLNDKKLRKIEKTDVRLREGNKFMQWGEPLAVFDSAKFVASKTNLKNYLFSKGFFNNEISTVVNRENRKVQVIYHIEENIPYTIDSLVYSVHDEDIQKLFFEHIEENELKGSIYEQEKITAELERVYDLMTNNGYFEFKRQYIQFEIDSTIHEQGLVIRETIVNPPGKNHHKIFKLDSIIFTTESGINVIRDKEPVQYQGVTYNFSSTKYPEKVLDWRIFLHKDSIYSKKKTLETQRQLSYLDIFKFVNINFDSTGGKFIANIFTSPLKKFQTSTEVGLSMLNQQGGLPGPFIDFNAKSRNIFSGLEIIQFDGNAGIQGISNVTDEDNTYSRLQYGGQLSTTFPQFLFPLKASYREKIGQYNPRTKIASGVNFEDRRDEYERTTFNGNFTYIWQIQNSSQLSIKPLDVSYIYADPDKFSDKFQRHLDSLREIGLRSLVSSFQSAFLSFSSVGLDLNINGYGLGNVTATYLKSFFEIGENVQNLFNQSIQDRLEFYRYLKTGIDYRRTIRLNAESALAYRANVGLAYIYGGNNSLPYEKYFFTGGSNSIRAWKPRRLGPGAIATYTNTTDSDGNPVIDYSFERPGEIILETSIELRKDLFGFVDYALFVDAGNIWLWSRPENTLDAGEENSQDAGEFRFRTFWREIAVGAGFGLRFDFSFLVLRTDFAYKVVNPGYPLGDRFVLDDFRFSDLWNRNKVELNIGIGYPF